MSKKETTEALVKGASAGSSEFVTVRRSDLLIALGAKPPAEGKEISEDGRKGSDV